MPKRLPEVEGTHNVRTEKQRGSLLKGPTVCQRKACSECVTVKFQPVGAVQGAGGKLECGLSRDD